MEPSIIIIRLFLVTLAIIGDTYGQTNGKDTDKLPSICSGEYLIETRKNQLRSFLPGAINKKREQIGAFVGVQCISNLGGCGAGGDISASASAKDKYGVDSASAKVKDHNARNLAIEDIKYNAIEMATRRITPTQTQLTSVTRTPTTGPVASGRVTPARKPSGTNSLTTSRPATYERFDRITTVEPVDPRGLFSKLYGSSVKKQQDVENMDEIDVPQASGTAKWFADREASGGFIGFFGWLIGGATGLLLSVEKEKQAIEYNKLVGTVNEMSKEVVALTDIINTNNAALGLVNIATANLMKGGLENLQQLNQRLKATRDNFNTLQIGTDAGLQATLDNLIQISNNVNVFSKDLTRNFNNVNATLAATAQRVNDLKFWTNQAFDQFDNVTLVLNAKLDQLKSITSVVGTNLDVISTKQALTQDRQLRIATNTIQRISAKLGIIEGKQARTIEALSAMQQSIRTIMDMVQKNDASIKLDLQRLAVDQSRMGLIAGYYGRVIEVVQHLRETLSDLELAKGTSFPALSEDSVKWAERAIYGDHYGMSLDEAAFNLDTMIMGRNRGLQMRSIMEWNLEYIDMLVANGAINGTSPRWYLEVMAEQLLAVEASVYTMQMVGHDILRRNAEARKLPDEAADHERSFKRKCFELEETMWRQDPVVGAYISSSSPYMNFPQTHGSKTGQTFNVSTLTRFLSFAANVTSLGRTTGPDRLALAGCRFCSGCDGVVSDKTALGFQCRFNNLFGTRLNARITIPLRPGHLLGLNNVYLKLASSPSPTKVKVIYFVPGFLQVVNPDETAICGVELKETTIGDASFLYLEADVCDKITGEWMGRMRQTPPTQLATSSPSGTPAAEWANRFSTDWNEMVGYGWVVGIGMYAEIGEAADDHILKFQFLSTYK